MASVIARPTYTDDDGSGTTGTIVSVALFTDIFDRIDAMFAGGGSYATFAFGGHVDVPSGKQIFWASRATMESPADAVIKVGNAAGTQGARLAFGSDSIQVQNAAGSDRGELFARAVDISGNLTTTNASLAPRSGTASSPSGKGLEIAYSSGSDYGYVLSYDRTGSAYKPLHIDASTLYLNTGSSGDIHVDGKPIIAAVGGVTPTGGSVGGVNIAQYYGNSAAGIGYLSDPDNWFRINVGGSDYKVPCYT